LGIICMMNLRNDFPILSEKVHGKPLVYFDNAATSQKPLCVIEGIKQYYESYNSNVHRGVHDLSQKATLAYENSRKTVQRFLNAKTSDEIVFTKGTTDAINIVANAWGINHLQKGDEIIISTMEHHSNIVPWQMVCEKTGAELVVSPINQDGELLISEFKHRLNSRTKLVAITHVSNTLGTINPIEQIIEEARKYDVKILIDAAQSAPHFALDMQKIDCDFLAFSGHKILAPTGIGVLYVKMDNYNEMTPFIGGGDMIKEVTFEKTTYNDPPLFLEAGTPNISGAIALDIALNYILKIGLDNIAKQESDLLAYATEEIKMIDVVQIIGKAKEKTSVLSFLLDNVHPFDVGTLLDQMGIAIRTGHHCTQPLMDFYQIPGTARASFAFYNSMEEVDYFISSLKKTIKLLS
jgi:cysteine desulfurase/selenocysteine lyase